MLNRLKHHFLSFDWIIFSVVLLLSLFGLIEIYSIALGQETLSLLNLEKQMIAIILGVISLFAFSFIDFSFIRSFSNYIYGFGVLILILVLIFGKTVRGTTGWFEIFGFSLQPVEFVKVIVIIFLAKFFSNTAFKMRPLKSLLLSLAGVAVFVFLIALQPDFGPVVIIMGLWFCFLILNGFKKKYLLMIVVPFILISFFLWNFYFKEYQKGRVLTLLNPGASSLSEGYNVSQALIAVGSGGLMGRGVGFGSQSQLKFLPEAQNDFIFSVISEELGFLGAALVLFLFFTLFWRLLVVSRKINNDFAVFIILGAVVLIFIEMFINIGMNIGLVPVMGISLPFISYGGSATIANFILIGIIQNIIIKAKS